MTGIFCILFLHSCSRFKILHHFEVKDESPKLSEVLEDRVTYFTHVHSYPDDFFLPFLAEEPSPPTEVLRSPYYPIIALTAPPALFCSGGVDVLSLSPPLTASPDVPREGVSPPFSAGLTARGNFSSPCRSGNPPP